MARTAKKAARKKVAKKATRKTVAKRGRPAQKKATAKKLVGNCLRSLL